MHKVFTDFFLVFRKRKSVFGSDFSWLGLRTHTPQVVDWLTFVIVCTNPLDQVTLIGNFFMRT
jgi:hypothetical protein